MGLWYQKKGLYLRAWDQLCTPILARGLGLQRMKDINIAFVKKLGWNLCTQPSKTWVQLIRSRYLKGRKITYFQHTAKASLWIWAGIQNIQDSLRKGLCIKVGRNSISHIRDDPWIPGLTNCSLPSEVEIADHLLYVCDLMAPDGTCWNATVVFDNFPPGIRDLILSIPSLENKTPSSGPPPSQGSSL